MERNPLNDKASLELRLVRDGDSDTNAAEITITFDECIGKGSTCLVYKGTCRSPGFTYPIGVIVKELYPSAPAITRDKDNFLIFPTTNSDFLKKQTQFRDSIAGYRQISRIPELKVTVPNLIGIAYGNRHNEYQIFDMYKGISFKNVAWKKISLYERINVIKKLAELFLLWYSKGFMLLDLSPNNIAYLKGSRLLQFVDFDSLLKKNGNRWERSVSGYRFNGAYLSSALLSDIRKDLSDPDYKAISPSTLEKICYYYLGAQAYSLLFLEELKQEYIHEDDVDDKINQLDLLYPTVMKHAVGNDLRCCLKKLFLQLFCAETGTSIIGFKEIIDALDHILELLRKTMDASIISQRYELLASSLLEKYPAYKYCSYIDQEPQTLYKQEDVMCENADKTIDVLIAGNHPLRQALMKYILSCIQMDHVTIKLHLFSSDVWSFWEKLKKDNPLIDKVIFPPTSGSKAIKLKTEWDKTVVDQPLAQLFLYTLIKGEKIYQICKENNIRYIFLLGDDAFGENILSKFDFNDCTERFVACLCQKRDPSMGMNSPFLSIKPISEEDAADALDQELINNHIYNRGFLVHTFYALGNNPYANRQQLKSEYDSKPYYQQNSIRSALHAIYKMVSAGIDPESATAAWEYHKKTKGNHHLLLKQAVLEHRSWMAFMIMTGATRPETVEDIDDYAYKNGNDWKNKEDPRHICHPCIAASGTTDNLSDDIWDRFDEIENIAEVESFLQDSPYNKFDELDRVSMRLHFIIKSRRRKHGKEIEDCLKEMQETSLYQKNTAFRGGANELIALLPTLKSEEGSFEGIEKWKELINNIKECSKSTICKEHIERLIQKSSPFTGGISLRHDFKQSDNDIINAVPKLFLRTSTPFSKPIGMFTIMRYLSGKPWVDLRASLFTDPEKLVLLSPINPQTDLQSYRKRCQMLLDNCSLDTKIYIMDKSEMSNLTSKETVFFDLTDTDGHCLDTIQIGIADATVHKIYFDGNTFITQDGDTSIDILKQTPILSVGNWMALNDCTMSVEGKIQRKAKLKRKEAFSLWNLMRRMKENDTDWNVFIAMLQKQRHPAFQKIYIPANSAPIDKYFSKELDSGLLQQTGLKLMLQKMLSDNIISDLIVQSDEDSGDETVSCQIKSEATFKAVVTAFTDAATYGKLCRISYTSLPDKKRIEITRRQIKVPKHINNKILNNSDYQDLFKFILRYDATKRTITFNSFAIADALLSEDTFFKAIIYAECCRKRVFDDLVINTGFKKCGDDIQYTPHLIGVKNGKVYPIIISDSTDYNVWRNNALAMMDGLSGKAIYLIKEAGAMKSASTYCCLTLDDVDEPSDDRIFVLRLADVLRQVIEK